jgi:dolichyl-phosphate-mannose--protein O-mannosyl transferase
MAMLGALVMACLVASVQFFKFWRVGQDRFFVWFGTAFAIFAVSYALRALTHDVHEHTYYVYLPRLVGFLLILAAILDKNRRVQP